MLKFCQEIGNNVIIGKNNVSMENGSLSHRKYQVKKISVLTVCTTVPLMR